jgi:hypothetical protein
LLHGAGFHFFEKGVWQIESGSHGQSYSAKMQRCKDAKMQRCFYAG